MVRVAVELGNVVPEASEQDSDLDGPASDEVIEANRAEWIIFQEHHQEAEADEYHDMYVLEQRIFFFQEIVSYGICVFVWERARIFAVIGCEKPVEKYADCLAY